jgi:hypothetical protein
VLDPVQVDAHTRYLLLARLPAGRDASGTPKPSAPSPDPPTPASRGISVTESR